METDKRDLKRRYDKRKRINSLKTKIVVGAMGSLLFLIVLCLILLVKVIGMSSEIKQLNNRLVKAEDYIAQASADAALKDEEDDDESTVEESEAAASSFTGEVALADQYDGKYGVTEHQEIYLTFDDGPSDNTEAILDVLDKYGVKGTFFVIGKTGETAEERYNMIVDRGHVLAMHSYTHKYSTLYSSLKSFKAEIVKERNYLEEVTGYTPWLFRFPGGSSNQVSNVDMTDLISYLNDEGITYFDWNVDSGDATNNSFTTDDLIDNVMTDIGKFHTAVILFHDTNNKTTTVEGLDELLPILLTRDADIKAIDENTDLVQHVKYDTVD
ncbi:MAG: polysaccharide deacetylase [Eubacterium sp.]|nr:polysaccharide deacetylase [Eubacterium sp.]